MVLVIVKLFLHIWVQNSLLVERSSSSALIGMEMIASVVDISLYYLERVSFGQLFY